MQAWFCHPVTTGNEEVHVSLQNVTNVLVITDVNMNVRTLREATNADVVWDMHLVKTASPAEVCCWL